MKTGMLWLGKADKSLVENISEAQAYYRTKYGGEPNICFVNSKEIPAPSVINGLTVEPVRTVLPRHLWLGVMEEGTENV